MYPDEVKIAISLAVDTTVDGRRKLGQTSRYLHDIAKRFRDFKEDTVTNRVFIKDSMFALPADQVATPTIMVGPGTGVVPFIGFL